MSLPAKVAKISTRGISVSSEDRLREAARLYKRTMGDEKEREKLIENYLPLVKSIVSRMRHHFPDTVESEDLYGIGAKALVLAVNQFDPSKGRSFGSYAGLRIKGSLLDELRRIDCLPRANRAKARSLQATIAELESKYQRPVSEDEVREELKVDVNEYRKLLKETQPVTFVPLDAPIDSNASDSGAPGTLSDVLSDPTETDALEQTESRERVALLRDRIRELPDQQKKILALYYYEEMKLAEIAQIFGLTEGRISQILSHTIISLRSHFRTLSQINIKI
ncbi:MAG: FliA/WhiG family RNA polymerase sigma factor [Opitutae bacterium]|nr:FliA/WhiG family RNA polymerase sigma factor [Opitutae bacterium]|tara:strand:+ start:1474 stop:2313 length:840 start_codon:yes stop_codon:yes gene_type:complete